jgi:hypothetical protein
MNKNSTLRALLAFLAFVLGNLQAWDSDVHAAGLLTVLLVSLAIAIPPVVLLTPVKQQYFVSAFVLSFIFIFLARLLSPIPLPGLFLALVPATMGLIFSGLLKDEA